MEWYIYGSAILAILALVEFSVAWRAMRWRLWRRVKPAAFIGLVLATASIVSLRMTYRRPPLEPAQLFAISKDWACASIGMKDRFCAPTRACAPIDKSSAAGPHDGRAATTCG